jgi:hypothetical protein
MLRSELLARTRSILIMLAPRRSVRSVSCETPETKHQFARSLARSATSALTQVMSRGSRATKARRSMTTHRDKFLKPEADDDGVNPPVHRSFIAVDPNCCLSGM